MRMTLGRPGSFDLCAIGDIGKKVVTFLWLMFSYLRIGLMCYFSNPVLSTTS